MKKYLTFKDDKSDKFWNIEVSENSFTVTYGKTGTAGQTQTKSFDDEKKCLKEAEKLLSEKLKKGYVEKDATLTNTKSVDSKKDSEPSNEYLKEWEKLVDAKDLVVALYDHFEYLIDSPGFEPTLKAIVQAAQSVFIQNNESLVVQFENDILVATPPIESTQHDQEWPKSFLNATSKHEKLILANARLTLGKGNFDTSILTEEDTTWKDFIRKGAEVLNPLSEYSDWWLYHPREKNSVGEPTIHFFSHEGGSPQREGENCNIGCLFLSRVAETMGISPQVAFAIKDSELGLKILEIEEAQNLQELMIARLTSLSTRDSKTLTEKDIISYGNFQIQAPYIYDDKECITIKEITTGALIKIEDSGLNNFNLSFTIAVIDDKIIISQTEQYIYVLEGKALPKVEFLVRKKDKTPEKIYDKWAKYQLPFFDKDKIIAFDKLFQNGSLKGLRIIGKFQEVDGIVWLSLTSGNWWEKYRLVYNILAQLKWNGKEYEATLVKIPNVDGLPFLSVSEYHFVKFAWQKRNELLCLYENNGRKTLVHMEITNTPTQLTKSTPEDYNNLSPQWKEVLQKQHKISNASDFEMIRNSVLHLNLCKGMDVESACLFNNLESLFLSNCNLNELPPCIILLQNLRSLFLDNNQFNEFPEILRKLKKLKYVDLENNKIKTMPDFLNGLSHLTVKYNQGENK
ncbi:leucine rich repeat protein [Leptospira santarosai str. CBC523]|uniref:WGR domain-containing protein n=1 Tax=Leptospira santarosai TaxID=28183 RepID=UPI0002BFBEB5|nr:WGR domain-containing protein [Leptospira santarosai]EMO14921.1 leucine rich repeat protein [Leptospira santarosai str. CBC523]